MTGRTATGALLLIFAGQPSEPSFLIERGRAGQFEIGMTADEVYRAAGIKDRSRVKSVWVIPDPERVRARRCPGRGR